MHDGTFCDFSASEAASRDCMLLRAASMAACLAASRFSRAKRRASGSPSTACQWSGKCQMKGLRMTNHDLTHMISHVREGCVKRTTCSISAGRGGVHSFQTADALTLSSRRGPLLGCLPAAEAGRGGGGAVCCCRCCCCPARWPFACGEGRVANMSALSAALAAGVAASCTGAPKNSPRSSTDAKFGSAGAAAAAALRCTAASFPPPNKSACS